MKSIFEKMLPFMFVGIMLVVLVLGIILFSYILILGAIVGCILYVIARIRKLFSSKQMARTHQPKQPGRIIDHDDK